MIKKLLSILILLLLTSPCSAWMNVTMAGAGGGAAACSNTVYKSHTFEASTNWYDGFDSYDNTPNDQMALDATSKIGGTKSVYIETSATAGGTSGTWNFAQTEFYAKVRVYISSSSTPTHGHAIMVSGAGGNQGVGFVLVYDTDHYEAQVAYRDDAGVLGYVIGATLTTGTTITADAAHTLYLYYKGGTGEDGEVWAKINSGEWVKDTGLDLDTKAAAIAAYQGVNYLELVGDPATDDFMIYVDDVLIQTCDPSL